MSFRVTLSDLGNVADLEAHKRKKTKPQDEVFLSIKGTPEKPEIEFQNPPPRDEKEKP